MQTRSELFKKREELINSALGLRGHVKNVPSNFLFSNDVTELYFIAPEEKGNKSSLFSTQIDSEQQGLPIHQIFDNRFQNGTFSLLQNLWKKTPKCPKKKNSFVNANASHPPESHLTYIMTSNFSHFSFFIFRTQQFLIPASGNLYTLKVNVLLPC